MPRIIAGAALAALMLLLFPGTVLADGDPPQRSEDAKKRMAPTGQPKRLPPGNELARYPEMTLEAVNVERGKAGAPPLRMDERLLKAAALRAKEAVEEFSHTRPSGEPFQTVLKEFGVKRPGHFGENLAMGVLTPQEAVDSWMTSTGHRDNMLEGKYRLTGIGVAPDQHGRLYWIQIFTD